MCKFVKFKNGKKDGHFNGTLNGNYNGKRMTNTFYVINNAYLCVNHKTKIPNYDTTNRLIFFYIRITRGFNNIQIIQIIFTKSQIDNIFVNLKNNNFFIQSNNFTWSYAI